VTEPNVKTTLPTSPATPASDALFARAVELLPGGVNSPVRAYGAVGGTPRFIARAQGAHVWDEDGHQLIDYVGAWGPMILGHRHRAVITAIEQQLTHGLAYGAPTALEVEMAAAIVRLVPSIEMVRMVSSGTEATMAALRLARAATGRTRVVKFEGCYHGHGDSFLVKAGSGAATFGTPDSPGVTAATARDTLTARFNDAGSVRELFAAYPGEIATVIVEPVVGNMGVVEPAWGFLQDLRDLCTADGALLIFDEVMTGFRVARGGAQERYSVTPDLTTLGKIIGGGLPVGAYGGRADLMRQISPSGPVYQAGTMSGHPLAMAAGLATLAHIEADGGLYDRLESLGLALEESVVRAIVTGNHPCRFARVGSMWTLFFTPTAVVDWPSAAKADRARYGRFFHGLLARGISVAPSQFEANFISAAHTLDDIARTADAIAASLEESRG
jgi:glutamate-1-semialdehyde 2,1-aminomutase